MSEETLAQASPTVSRWIIVTGSLVVVVAVGALLFIGIGRWLVVEDPLAQADAIVILSGNLPTRALEAARLYNAGYAPQVWISQGLSPAEQLKAMKISYLGEDFYNEKILLVQGVPVDAIRILERPSANTEMEVREIKEFLRQNNAASVIIVASKPQTRRVRAIWNKIVGPDPRAMVRFASDDPYDGAHWWRRSHDALDVVRESLGLLNAWAGFPVRPSQN